MREVVQRRWVVLHADDFGMNAAVNAGILQSFRDGLLTSTSLLANAPAAAAACHAWPQLIVDLRAGAIASAPRRAQLGDDLSPFDLGIHLNLTQGHPLSANYPSELLNDRGEFPGIGPVFRQLRSVRSRFRNAVLTELQSQIEWMLDHDVSPTHLNGHQYVELMPCVVELIPLLTAKYSIPVVRVAHEPHLAQTVLLEGRVVPFAIALIKRHYARRMQRLESVRELSAPMRFFGTAHAGLVTRPMLERFLRCSSPRGCTEIGLHPATAPQSDARLSGDEWFDPLAALRPNELQWLCDHSTAEVIASHGLSLGRLSQIVEPT